MTELSMDAVQNWQRRYGASFGKLKAMLAGRHVVVLVCFLATFCAYVERLGFTIAYTRMAKAAQLDERVKGRVLSAFYWGYALSQATLKISNPVDARRAADRSLAAPLRKSSVDDRFCCSHSWPGHSHPW